MNKTYRNNSLPHLKAFQQTTTRRLIYPNPKIAQDAKITPFMEIGAYSINRQDLLGRGFCSQVFGGFHSKTGSRVAAKLIEFEKIKGPIQKRLVKNQIKNLSQMRNARNILKLHEIITTKLHVVFITELCKESLSQKLKSNNAIKKEPLPRPEAIKIIKEVLVGYYWMREHGLLHRDIKPANILMGEDGEVRLGDFGFSIRDEQVQKDKHVNLGSPMYMAPEVLKGNQYSSKADMWAIGLTFLEMLIGNLPWEAVKQCNLHEKLLEIDINAAIPLDLDGKYREVLLKCLELDPRRRMGVREMMGYLFTKEEISNICNRNRSVDQSSMQDGKISIPTTITDHDEPKTEDVKQSQLFVQRSDKLLSNRYNPSEHLSNKCSREGSTRRSVRLLKDRADNRNQAITLKLKVKSPDEQERILQQQMNELHFCRFLFKMVQLIANGKDNIHNTYLDLHDKVSIELAQNLLYNLEQIREIKSDYSPAVVREFRKSKDFRRILELTEKYENNYLQFFEIQLNQEIEARLIDSNYLIESLSVYLSKGKEHFELILQEVQKSELKIINDEEICQFSYLVEFIARLIHLLGLKKKGREGFTKYGKVEQLSKRSITSISLAEMRKIHQRLNN